MDRWLDLLYAARGNLLSSTLKASLAIAFLSMIAVNLVDRQLEKDRAGMAQLAAQAAKGTVQDPMTTGSVRKPAQFDPKKCRETVNGNYITTTCIRQ